MTPFVKRAETGTGRLTSAVSSKRIEQSPFPPLHQRWRGGQGVRPTGSTQLHRLFHMIHSKLDYRRGQLILHSEVPGIMIIVRVGTLALALKAISRSPHSSTFNDPE